MQQKSNNRLSCYFKSFAGASTHEIFDAVNLSELLTVENLAILTPIDRSLQSGLGGAPNDCIPPISNFKKDVGGGGELLVASYLQ